MIALVMTCDSQEQFQGFCKLCKQSVRLLTLILCFVRAIERILQVTQMVAMVWQAIKAIKMTPRVAKATTRFIQSTKAIAAIPQFATAVARVLQVMTVITMVLWSESNHNDTTSCKSNCNDSANFIRITLISHIKTIDCNDVGISWKAIPMVLWVSNWLLGTLTWAAQKCLWSNNTVSHTYQSQCTYAIKKWLVTTAFVNWKLRDAVAKD